MYTSKDDTCKDEIVQAFQKEIDFAKSHPHPCIVQILGYCEESVALVCEFMAGGDLLATLQSPQKLS